MFGKSLVVVSFALTTCFVPSNNNLFTGAVVFVNCLTLIDLQAVTTAVALQYGFGSSLFAICTCFSVIVMYDAMGVRRHAGLQAEVLNAVVEDLLEHHPVSERKLKEVLGHTPRQVLCGAILGVLVGLSYPKPF
jgi:acid phosphatase family membrane protein YuiD